MKNRKYIYALIISLFTMHNKKAMSDINSAESPTFPEIAEWNGLYFGSYRNSDIALNLMLDQSFGESEKATIKNAMSLFMARTMDEKILDCAYKNTIKDFPHSKEGFREHLYSALGVRKLNDLRFFGFAYIERNPNLNKIVGSGKINLFYEKTDPSPGYNYKNYFHIAINPIYLSTASESSMKRGSQYWAGVLSHLFLHNLGYDHPTGTSGSFTNEYSNCISGFNPAHEFESEFFRENSQM